MTTRVIEPVLSSKHASCPACGASIKSGRFRFRRALWILILLFLGTLYFLRWGGHLLMADDPVPEHADAAVVLQGSVLGEKARMAGAVKLLQAGTSNRILVSIPRETYWGQRVAPIAQNYLEGLYGRDIVAHMDFCETSADVNSTQLEAVELVACARGQGLHSIVVVTSDYHTRRAGIIWRRVVRPADSSLQLWIHGVNDPEFNSSAWWRERLSAKTWVQESVKLLWVFGDVLRQDLHIE